MRTIDKVVIVLALLVAVPVAAMLFAPHPKQQPVDGCTAMGVFVTDEDFNQRGIFHAATLLPEGVVKVEYMSAFVFPNGETDPDGVDDDTIHTILVKATDVAVSHRLKEPEWDPTTGKLIIPRLKK